MLRGGCDQYAHRGCGCHGCRKKMVVKCDVYIQAQYIYIYIYTYGYMEKTEMYNVTLSQVKERGNIFI